MTAPTLARVREPVGSPTERAPGALNGEQPIRSWQGPAIAAVTFLVARLSVVVVAKASTWLLPELKVSQLLAGWDGAWYLQIAANGYPDVVAQGQGPLGNEWAFFPGYPLLIRGCVEVTGLSYVACGILVSILAGAVFAAALFVLIVGRLGFDNARSATTLLSFFPAAYVLGMAYTESLFLALAALCLVAIDRRYWIAAGLLACIVGAVRPSGVALVLVVGFCLLREIAARRATWRTFAGALLAPLGIGTWMVVQWAEVGSPTAFLRAQEAWFNRFVWFTTPFKSFWLVLTDRETLAEPSHLMAAGALVLVAVSTGLAIAFAVRNRGVVPVEWWVYSAVTVVFAASPYWPTSVLRYTMAAFPLLAVAMAMVPRPARAPLLCVSAVAMATLAFVAFGGIADWQHAPMAP